MLDYVRIINFRIIIIIIKCHSNIWIISTIVLFVNIVYDNSEYYIPDFPV